MRFRSLKNGRSLASAASVLLLAACTSHGTAPTPAPSPSSDPPSSSPTDTALRSLRAQASEAARTSFSATYTARGVDQTGKPTSNTMRIFRAPDTTRIDVTDGDVTTRILALTKGMFACRLVKTSAQWCVALPGPGDPAAPLWAAPREFALLFTAAPAKLATGSGYEVRSAPALPARGDAPASSCYSLVSTPDDAGLQPGTYCYADGMLVSADFRTGSLELTEVGTPPVSGDFTLPASPVPLPSATSS